MPLITSVIMALAAGCGSAHQLKGQVDISAGSCIAYISAQAAGARFRILAEADTLRPVTRGTLVASMLGPAS
jgi:hypothetical protein